MRAVVSTLLALHLVLAAFVPHVHVESAGSEPCAVCVSRAPAVAGSGTPDVAPEAVLAGEAQLVPGLAPVTGAPLGAIPGQSPPSASR